MDISIAPFALGFDSLIVCFALAPIIPSVRQRFQLAAWFGICDGAAMVLGSLLTDAEHGLVMAADLAPLLTLIYGVGCLLCAGLARSPIPLAGVWLFPVAMCLDNAVYGSTLGSAGAGVAAGLMAGVATLLMSLSGLVLGRILHWPSVTAQTCAAGCALITVGACQLWHG